MTTGVKIKKIIARERLIILLLLFLAVGLLSITDWIEDKKVVYWSKAKTIQVVSIQPYEPPINPEVVIMPPPESKRIIPLPDNKEAILEHIYVATSSDTSDDEINKTLKRDFPEIENIGWLSCKVTEECYQTVKTRHNYKLVGLKVTNNAIITKS